VNSSEKLTNFCSKATVDHHFIVAVIFPEISAKTWEIISSIFSFEFADIPGSRAKSSYFFSEYNA